ncbi:MAG TPA: transporter [Cytophagales bacterium]|nr:transporter [Cytophagales bacterium]HAA19688.1 transporter [Cytophagales bacterium]HAP61651.1 transporter [Cytophagales bacterium]
MAARVDDNNQVGERDPGIGTKFGQSAKRVINKNGTFNVVRRGTQFSTRNVYQAMLRMAWPVFLGLVVGAITLLNALFAIVYVIIGVDQIQGITTGGLGYNFLQAFYFSFQTFTTVGYGALSPMGSLAAFVASMEAMFGLISFALATSLLYGRFSKPSARLQYSTSVLISPSTRPEADWSLQFRIANMRQSTLMELNAHVILTTVEKVNGEELRKYARVTLERDSVLFFPLNWTVVHHIDENSPFYGKSLDDLHALHAEILILIKGFDDTFSQTVHSRYSYTCHEFVWGAKFLPCYETDEHGDVVLHLDRLDDYEMVMNCPIHVKNDHPSGIRDKETFA